MVGAVGIETTSLLETKEFCVQPDLLSTERKGTEFLVPPYCPENFHGRDAKPRCRSDEQNLFRERKHNFRVARLNVVAGATDASRAMLLTPCCKVELLTAIFGFL